MTAHWSVILTLPRDKLKFETEKKWEKPKLTSYVFVNSYFLLFFFYTISHRMTKPTQLPVRPVKSQISMGISRSATDKRFLHMDRTAKTLLRLGGYPGWSEYSLGAQVISLVLTCCGSQGAIICKKQRQSCDKPTEPLRLKTKQNRLCSLFNTGRVWGLASVLSSVEAILAMLIVFVYVNISP